MKNKKLLNVYLLCVALLSLITFILPMPKTSYESGTPLFLNIVYYATSTLLIISLCLIIVISIINLFSDNYDGVKYSLALSFIGFLMVFINLVIYSSNWFYSISYGYVLVAIEVFILYSFNNFIKIINSLKDFKSYFLSVFPGVANKEKKQKQKPVVAQGDTKIKNNKIKGKKSSVAESSIINNKSDTKQPLSDNIAQNIVNTPEIATGEKE